MLKTSFLHVVAVRTVPLLTALAVTSCATTDNREPRPDPRAGYLQSASGGFVRDGNGQCWRTGRWEPGMNVSGCGALASAAAPAAQAQATAPADTSAAPPAASAPAEPVPAPVAQAQPAAEPQTVYVGTDAYFGFNQAELSGDAKRKLETIVQRARDADGATVRVVGHADQIGADDYNMTLSQRRADAVRTYLVEQGITQDAVQVEARGESDPIVNCEGQQGTSLIDCLQINRRTEVEFAALQPVER